MKNDDLLSRWLEESPENRRALQEESLILDASEAIFAAMGKRGMSKAALAKKLGSSKAHVTQLLNGGRNMTLRTFARIAFSLDMAPSLGLKDQTFFVESDDFVGQDHQHSTNSWNSQIIGAPPRKPKVPAVLVQEASADWTGFGQLEDAA